MTLPTTPPPFSLIISTRGRTWQLERLLTGFQNFSGPGFEVVVVDQNLQGLLDPILDPARWSFPINWIQRPDDRGAPLGRNLGWRAASGDFLVFPDDDAWYPPDFLERAAAILEKTGADLLTGRSVNAEGRTINGRFARVAGPITSRSVWIQQQEWLTIIRRDIMGRIGGWPDDIGIGGPTPWQSAEGPDVILRSIKAGARTWYDPDLTASHDEFDVANPDARMMAKGRAYGRGMGFVLRKHDPNPLTIAYWMARAFAAWLSAAGRGHATRARYLAFVALGRWEGWTRKLWSIRSPDGFDETDTSGSGAPG